MSRGNGNLAVSLDDALARAAAPSAPRISESEQRIRRDSSHFLVECLRYHELRGRQNVGLRLTRSELSLVRQLEQLLLAEPPPGPAAKKVDLGVNFLERLDPRRPAHLSIAFRTPTGRLEEGLIQNVSRGGAFIATLHPGVPGEDISVRFVEAADQSEWQFGARVAWVRLAETPGMGVRFVGTPVQVRCTPPGPAARPQR